MSIKTLSLDAIVCRPYLSPLTVVRHEWLIFRSPRIAERKTSRERTYSIIESVVHAVASSSRRANCAHYRASRIIRKIALSCNVFERFLFLLDSVDERRWNQSYRGNRHCHTQNSTPSISELRISSLKAAAGRDDVSSKIARRLFTMDISCIR